MLENHDIQGQPRAVSEPHVDIDLTVTPPPQSPAATVQPSSDADKAKPSLVKIWFHVYTPIPKTKAEKQAGTAQKLPEFQFRRISNQPCHPHQHHAAPADNVQTTSQIPNNRTESPIPGPPPPLEDFLTWAKISPDNENTRALLKKLDIIDYKALLSSSLDVPTLAGLGFVYGTAVRLHDQAPLYQAELKRHKDPGFWD
ncbi:uncharacterized protein MELLADRAFT_106313 [Melampsora larici-populina 98AG31]|uniref:Uncharacterized protein n=1 Tax=Melampsora larici-populina (strain 98AG31 / pathotype 3-4-7) TaxID=747676 RepID=F4RKZ2_MELLP|nr:uncharacterized protein MELLADRAFT_106313 [Melampsora larici-populina 98AG31]EGG06951.1 hypothetical protein MELLADRAFT_106313 [Melampsora larici-populina 98AG31]